ncbi:MAG: glucosaminidase domain-containing protein [Bacteroidales bacterium]|jgi:Bax protein|nr:glucosaminidase domain-containing protein [Bacteroidales bacterium]
MSRIIPKSLILIGLTVLLIIFFPKTGDKSVKEAHTKHYNENLFLNKSSIPGTHKNFILKLIPLIQQSNHNVLLERERLLQIYYSFSEGKKIKQSEKKWLKMIENKYRGETNETLFENNKQSILFYLDELLSRVEMVPIRFTLAQAAIESGWGTSRFCLEGNAYFGIHCYKPGCGIKAGGDQKGGFEVKSYKSVQESVDDYVLFLNSKRSMKNFRKERVNYFYGDSSLWRLAGSIKGYSAIGQSYQLMIESILRIYIPEGIANS